jgi:CHAT domain-containing protein
LFLAANPKTTSHLDLEEELRSLESELRGVKYRDQVVLTARHAVRPDDLVRYVRSERPTVVHFSGHGSGQGIILRNDEGGYTEVTGASLQRFFLNRGVRLVVLNACYTQEQAKLLPGSVSAVVGTTEAVGDRAAQRFTVAFYRTLGDGHSIREAFRDGGDAVILDNREDVFWSDGELDQLRVTPAGS